MNATTFKPIVNTTLSHGIMNATGNSTTPLTSTTPLYLINSTFNWTYPTLPPILPTFIITPQPVYYYTYSLYGYLAVLLLLVLMLIAIKLAVQRRNEIARRAALSRRARQCNTVTTLELANQTGNQPPKDDLPPAYDDVVQQYVNAKLALQVAEEGQVVAAAAPQGASLTNAPSTLTIETFVDANAGSSNDLSGVPSATNTTGSNNPTSNSTALPPTYERCISNNAANAGSNNNNSS